MNSRYYLLLVALFVTLLAPPSASAQPNPGSFGFGLILGEPSGLTLKGSLSGPNSWDAAIGKSWFGGLHIHADYLWDLNVFNSNSVGMYFGVGGVLGFGTGDGIFVKGDSKVGAGGNDEEGSVAIGGRVVAGINAVPFAAPLEFFLELAPIIGFVPGFGVGTGFSLGIRFYP